MPCEASISLATDVLLAACKQDVGVLQCDMYSQVKLIFLSKKQPKFELLFIPVF